MHLAGPREVCVCITYSREAWIEGTAAGGHGGDSTRNESGLERETNMTSQQEIPLSVYMQGGEWIEALGEYIFCVWCLCWDGWV